MIPSIKNIFSIFLFISFNLKNYKVKLFFIKEAPWSSDLTRGSLMLLHREFWVSIPGEAGLCKLNEKRLTRNLQHGARSTVKHEFYRAAQVMQSCVNLFTAGRIIGCRIVYNIFHNYLALKKNYSLSNFRTVRNKNFYYFVPLASFLFISIIFLVVTKAKVFMN